MSYSKIQLEAIWEAAGGPKQYADIASAVALAESGGNANSTDNDSNGTVDRGLWQINSVHGAQSTYSVLGNAQAAVSISDKGTDWSPWVTYNSGAYKKYLGSGALATNGSKSGLDSLPGASVVNGAANAVKGAASDAASVASALGWIFKASNADRVLKVLGGGAIVLLALTELVKAGGK